MIVRKPRLTVKFLIESSILSCIGKESGKIKVYFGNNCYCFKEGSKPELNFKGGNTVTLQKGDFVIFEGVLAVIVGTETDIDIPTGHVALWYGQNKQEEALRGRPEVWTVPKEYCQSAQSAIIQH